MEFVIEQLATENKSISFNHWVTNIAKKRVQYIQPMVNKCLAKVLLEKGGKENWDTLNGMMRTDFIKIINKSFSHSTSPFNSSIFLSSSE